MEINLPLNARSQMLLDGIKDISLLLKVGQIIGVNVIRVNQDINTLTLELGNNTLQVQSSPPKVLSSGDQLKLEVVQLSPRPEFKVISLAQDTRTPSPSQFKPPGENILLKVPVPGNDSKTPIGKNLLPPPIPAAAKEPVTATILALSGNRVQLQLSTRPAADSTLAPVMEVALDRTETTLFKPGQMVILQPVRPEAGAALKFKIALMPATLTELFKQYLPIHKSPVQFIDQLITDLPALQRSESVPTALKRLAQEIMQQLPQRHQLMQETLIKRVISNSGLFLEAKLAVSQESSTSAPASDFKAQLLKFIEILKQETNSQTKPELTPPDEREQLKILLQKTESGIAKIILDQLASLPKEDSTQQLWHLEMPFLDKGKAESVKIEIEQDKPKNESSGKPAWSVTITITPPHLGTLHCKVAFLDGEINTYFWSQQAPVTRLVKQNLDILRRQLEDSGLTIGRMDALDGEPAQSKCQGPTGETLLDEKA